VTLVLEGVKSNRAAFGAEIDVRLKEPEGKVRHIYRTVGFGSSFGGNPLRQHIGIGDARRIAEVVVTWPATGVVDRVKDVAIDKTYALREGEGRLRPLSLR
jgi:hypothetical protein